MELIIIGIFILFQVIAFMATSRRINTLRELFPSPTPSAYSAMRVNVSDEQLRNNDVESLLTDVQAGKTPEVHFMLSQTPVVLLRTNQNKQTLFGDLADGINRYILKCRTVAPDFGAVQGMAEREYERIVKDIESTIQLPLYIGMMGTLFGIIFGLFQLDISGDLEGNDIQFLLYGVKIAMIAGFVGLLLTTLSNTFLFKNAQNEADLRKNKFYRFIQTDLLTASSGDLATVVASMQKNLELFNDKFRGNILEFDKSTAAIFENTRTQRDFLSKLNEMDFQKVVAANIEIFNKLTDITGEFDKFTVYISQLNQNMAAATQLGTKLDTLIGTAEGAGLHIASIAKDVDSRLATSNEVMQYMKQHSSAMEERKSVLAKAIIDFDSFLQKTLTQLEQTALERSIAIKDNLIKQEDAMLRSFSSAPVAFQKLEVLHPINEQLSVLTKEMILMRQSVTNMEAELKSAANDTSSKGMIAKFKNIFGR